MSHNKVSIRLNVIELDEGYRLHFLFPWDKSGILYIVSMVLFAHGWDIVQAFSQPNVEAEFEDIFEVVPSTATYFDEKAANRVRSDIEMLLEQGAENKPLLSKYLDKFPSKSKLLQAASKVKSEFRVNTVPGHRHMVLEVRRPDRPGVLMQICKALHEIGIDIISFKADTLENQIFDEFTICYSDGEAISENDLTGLEDRLSSNMDF